MGWGRVLEGPDGWRSEFAKLTAIIAFTFVVDPATFYGVPVLAPRTKEEEGSPRDGSTASSGVTRRS